MGKARTESLTASIGVDLEDLGIESENSERGVRRDYNEYPKAYDFTLDLFLHRGSWQKMRDTLRAAVIAAYNGEPPLHFSMYWAEMEAENEESIQASLTGLRYDKQTYETFKARIRDWAETETDTVLTREVITDPAVRRLLLVNHPALEPQVLRDIYDLVKDEEGGPQMFIEAESEIPDDVLEVMAKQQYPAGSRVLWVLILRYDMTEQMLLDMVGKGVDGDILDDEACTDRVSSMIHGRHSRKAASRNKLLTAEAQDRLGEILSNLEIGDIANYSRDTSRCSKAAN